MNQGKKLEKRYQAVFMALFALVLGVALFWPQIEKALESEPTEGTLMIVFSDGEPASGAKVRMIDSDGNELAVEEANRKGRVDLPDLEWDRLLIEADYHGFPQRAVVRGPISTWPYLVELEGP